jgi:hypothetical protein
MFLMLKDDSLRNLHFLEGKKTVLLFDERDRILPQFQHLHSMRLACSSSLPSKLSALTNLQFCTVFPRFTVQNSHLLLK